MINVWGVGSQLTLACSECGWWVPAGPAYEGVSLVALIDQAGQHRYLDCTGPSTVVKYRVRGEADERAVRA